TLGSSLVISSNVRIAGPGASSLTVSGGGSSSDFSVFVVNSGVTASISLLTIANGYTTGNGGGVLNSGTLTLTNDPLSGNAATGPTSWGGGIYNDHATVTLTNVTLDNNSAYAGGGLVNDFGTATLSHVTLSSNAATYGGG